MTKLEYSVGTFKFFGYPYSTCGCYYNCMPYTPVQQQMTFGYNQAQQRPRRMDPYLSSVYVTEQSLYDPPIRDKTSLDTSVYASSPNSLFMYEQEKADMQSSLGNMTCSRKNEDFDLNSKLETSCDIALPMSKGSPMFIAETPESQSNTWPMDTKSDVDFLNCDVFQMDEEMDNPTLAELNASESLLDDLASIVGPNSSVNNKNKTWKQENGSEISEQVQQLKGNWSSTVQLPQTSQQSSLARPVFCARKPSATVTSESDNNTVSTRMSQLLHIQTSPIKIESESTTSPVQSVPNPKIPTSPAKRKQNISNKEVDEKWEEIKHYIYDDDEQDEDIPQPKQTRLSTDSYKSVVTSNDESDMESDRESHDSDSDYDDHDDNSQDSWSYKHETDSSQRKSRQYFWQYNLQSKGPKGARVSFEQLEQDDPHVVKDFEDPVFDPVASKNVAGTTIRHGGKARRGDGTDVSPNPKKLYQIGQQINKLNKQIDSFIPLSEMPVSSRNKSKKEKNKLASRACRLKKKAQHEAYKIKLHGLDMEHKQLLQLTQDMKQKFTQVLQKTLPERKIVKQEGTDDLQMTQYLEKTAEKAYTYKVAGDTSEFVNRVLCKVEEGDPTGGLDQS